MIIGITDGYNYSFHDTDDIGTPEQWDKLYNWDNEEQNQQFVNQVGRQVILNGVKYEPEQLAEKINANL